MLRPSNFRCIAQILSARYLWLIWLLFLLANAGFLFYQFAANNSQATKINTNIMAVMPKYQQADAAASVAKSEELRNRQVLLAFKFADAVEPALLKSLSAQLHASGLFKFNDDNATIAEFMQLGNSLFAARQQLLSQQDLMLFKQDNGMQQIVANAREQIYGFGRVDAAGLKSDSLFLYKNYLQSFAPNFLADFNRVDEFLQRKYAGSYYYLLPLKLQQSAFDANVQSQVKQELDSLREAVQTYNGKLLAVGSVIFAEAGFAQTKKELSTVGLGGIIGIVILLLMAFGSLLPLCWLLLSLVLSLLVALNITLLVFGQLHVFALLFSAAIIGVGADYGFHFYTDIYQASKRDSKATITHILPSLSLGMVSSVLAYALFLILDFPVLAQAAMLAVVGLPSMYLSVLLILPKLPIGRQQTIFVPIISAAKILFSNPIISKLKFLQRPVNLIILLFVVVGIDIYMARIDDDVRNLQQLSTENIEIEQQIRELLQRPYVAAYDVLVAADGEKLLAAEQILLQAKISESYQPVYELLPAANAQRYNWQAYKKIYEFAGSLELSKQLGGALDFSIQPFVALDINKILRHNAILRRFAEQLLLLDNNDLALLIPHDSATVQPLLLPAGVRHYIINPVADISSQFAIYRQQMLILLLAVTALLLLLAIWRYRQHGIIVALLPAVAAALALFITILLGFYINLFSVLALLLVLGMGLDYVVFLAEAVDGSKVMVSLLLSAISTLLSFGLLAFSQTLAVATFGITVALGIALILFLAPLAYRQREQYE